jgi:hypothetical protein
MAGLSSMGGGLWGSPERKGAGREGGEGGTARGWGHHGGL